jgi:hypothetical protein
MNNRKNTLMIVLFYGGLWGIMEATLGYALHLLPCGFAGMFMFPLGFYFMYNAFKSTNQHKVIFFTAVVAASIKLTDLLIPLNTITSVANPAVSIILEGLVVFAGVKIMAGRRNFAMPFLVSLAWTVLFPAIQSLILQPPNGLYQESPFTLFSFVIITTFFSGTLISTYLKKGEIISIFKLKFQKLNLLAMVVPGAAVIFELGNSIIF